MAIRIASPGVYIQERSAFGNSIVASSTAIPAFIGYTEKANKNGDSILNIPTVIDSLDSFEKLFGMAWVPSYGLVEADQNGTSYHFESGKTKYVLNTQEERYYLYDSLRLFFANGGGKAYTVSVGYYGEEVDSNLLVNGVRKLKATDEPTLVVVPDAMALTEEGSSAVQQEMLLHCEESDNRFAILDVYGGIKERSYDDNDIITSFRNKVGNVGLKYGASYFPWVKSNVVSEKEFSYIHFADRELLVSILEKNILETYEKEKKINEALGELEQLKTADSYDADLHQTLKVVAPIYKTMLLKVAEQLNVLPPSGAIAGAYSRIDNNNGVWKSPANEGLIGVVEPIVNLTSSDQEDLNINVGGKSVNAIRTFSGEGTLIWGARTLDGNSQDWRYINVRRTMSFIESSIKNSIKSYVFEPNNPMTWVSVKGVIDTFLQNLWIQGALVGTTASDAFIVDIGLGSTMTQADILDGIMKISVQVAISRPAEFIVISFEQKLQS